MVVERGQIWWAELGDPGASEPRYRRPVLVVQTDGFNRSRIATTVVVTLSSNLRLAEAPGNVFVPADEAGLQRDSVVNVSQVLTLNKTELQEHVGRLPSRYLRAVTEGLKLVLFP